MSNSQSRLLVEIDKMSEYLVFHNWPYGEVELFYEFCYNKLMEVRRVGSIEDAIHDVYLAFYGMVFGENHEPKRYNSKTNR